MDAAHPRVFFDLIKRIGPAIEDLDRAAAERDAPNQGAVAGSDLDLALDALVFGHPPLPGMGSPPVFAILKAEEPRLVSAAQPDRPRADELQHQRTPAT